MPPRAATMIETPQGPRLQGVKCRQCGARSFPPARFCRSCHAANPDTVELAANGRIEAVGSYDGTAFGEIRLADGMLVAGRIEPAKRAAVGRPVTFQPADGLVRFTLDD